MLNKFKLKIAFAAFTMALIIIATVAASPFKKYHCSRSEIKNTILIHAPVHEVYAYLGNSSNASKWSVFVSKIYPLNSDVVQDGTKGSIRRCLVRDSYLENAFWDEVITKVIPNKKRQLSIYNLNHFPVEANGLLTEQQYESIDEHTTLLTFTLFYDKESIPLWDNLKTHFAAYQIEDIFIRNMENIKNEIENQKTLVGK